LINQRAVVDPFRNVSFTIIGMTTNKFTCKFSIYEEGEYTFTYNRDACTWCFEGRVFVESDQSISAP